MRLKIIFACKPSRQFLSCVKDNVNIQPRRLEGWWWWWGKIHPPTRGTGCGHIAKTLKKSVSGTLARPLFIFLLAFGVMVCLTDKLSAPPTTIGLVWPWYNCLFILHLIFTLMITCCLASRFLITETEGKVASRFLISRLSFISLYLTNRAMLYSRKNCIDQLNMLLAIGDWPV